MNNRFLWLSIICIIIFGGYCGRGHLRDYDFEKEREALSLFVEAHNLLKSNSVYGVDIDSLFNSALSGMFSSLGDIHSSYLDSASFYMLSEQVRGEFGGVGFVFTMRGDDFVVLYTLLGSPSSLAGIRSRDILFKVGGKGVRGLNYTSLANMIRGKPGTDISITVLRDGKELEFSFKRAIIGYNDFDYKVLDGGIAYLKINQFSNATAARMAIILRSLRKIGLKGIIIDLRDNVGGSLFSCVYVVNYFLSGRKLILRVIGKGGITEHILTDSNLAIFPKIPLVVLSNGKTASASEIFIGVMQDHNRGIVMGERTYGKGSVQELIHFNTISQVGAKLTYARWYTPKGRAIDGKGLEPDIEIRVPELSYDEKYYVSRLLEENIIYDYVKRNEDLTDADISNFIGMVRDRGFILGDNIIIRLLKKEKYSYTRDLFIDMDYDIVLSRAFSYLTDKTTKGFW